MWGIGYLPLVLEAVAHLDDALVTYSAQQLHLSLHSFSLRWFHQLILLIYLHGEQPPWLTLPSQPYTGICPTSQCLLKIEDRCLEISSLVNHTKFWVIDDLFLGRFVAWHGKKGILWLEGLYLRVGLIAGSLQYISLFLLACAYSGSAVGIYGEWAFLGPAVEAL